MDELRVGQEAPDPKVKNLQGTIENLKELLDGRTMLFFLRDYACVLTQMYMQQLKEKRKQFAEHGVNVLLVVNADRKIVSHEMTEKEFPYTVICDAQGSVYEAYHVGCAVDKAHLGNEKTMRTIQKAYEMGYNHGTDSGNPLRLPAIAVIDEKGKLDKILYGKYGDDLPEPAELAAML